jgi:hypothetical protein
MFLDKDLLNSELNFWFLDPGNYFHLRLPSPPQSSSDDYSRVSDLQSKH